jgi:hypothetical protein
MMCVWWWGDVTDSGLGQWTPLSTLLLRFGGFITLFHCSIPVQGSQYNITSEKL